MFQDQTGNSQVTLFNNPNLSIDGINFINSESQYAQLMDTNFGGNQVTISIWANFHSNNNWQRLIDFGQGQSDDNIIIANAASSGKFGCNINNGSSNIHDIDSSLNILYGSWHHVCLVYNHDVTTSTLYIDGVSDTSITTTEAIPTLVRDKSYIGRSNWSNDTYFDGQIKSINIWQRALSPVEVAGLYELGRGFNAYDNKSSLIVGGHWPGPNKNAYTPPTNYSGVDVSGSEGFYGSIIDFREYSHALTDKECAKIVDNELLGTEVFRMPLTKSNLYEYRLNRMPEFTGTNYMEIPYDPALNTKKFSVSVWAYTNKRVNLQRMFDNLFDAVSGTTSRHGFHVLQISNKWSFRIEDGNNSITELSIDFDLNKWYHYVFQYDGTKRIIYENGVKTAENTRALSLNTQERFTIGAKFDNTSPFHGNLHDFRYYNRAISASEIDDIYRNGKFFGDEVLRLPETAHVGIPRLLKSVKEVDTTDYTSIHNYEIKVQFSNQTNHGTSDEIKISFLIDSMWSREYTFASNAYKGTL